MALTDEQLAERRKFLGGTDMAALAGMSPYAKPIDVWLDKTGQAPPRTANPMMALGSLLEPVVADLFTEATGMVLRRPSKPVRDPVRPYLGGNIDRWAYIPRIQQGGTEQDAMGPWEAGVFEAKWAENADRWGPSAAVALPGGKVPPGYRVQVQHYLGVTGRPVGYLAVLLRYADFRWYVIERDQEAIDMLRELGERFWRDNVLAGVPPEPDGSESYGAYLQRKWRTTEDVEQVATRAQARLWEQYREHLELGETVATALEEARQRLEASMGTTTKLLLPDGSHITWRSHEQKRTEWAAVAHDLAAAYLTGSGEVSEADIEQVLAHATRPHTTTTTVRPFRPTIPKEDA